MRQDATIERWFCDEVLPLEYALTQFIQRNWRVATDVEDLRHDIYERVIGGARVAIPTCTRGYVFTTARNHLINKAKRLRIVSIDLVADLEALDLDIDIDAGHRHLEARDTLRQVAAGMEKLSPRVREIVRLRKIEGLNVRETANRLGIGRDAVSHQLMMGMRALADHMAGGSGRIVRPRRSTRRKADEL